MIKTRFAPSPTGELHIGGARTALFAFLFAKHNKGQFLLRIEDTDRERFVENSDKRIVESLNWLGIVPDNQDKIMFQSARLPIYKKYVLELLKKGNAYICDCSKERLSGLRKEQEEKKLPTGYDRHCRNISRKSKVESIKQLDDILATGAVVRMKMPEKGLIKMNDMVRGEVVFEASHYDDQVIMKSDGFPTYHMAHIVDDHEMEISHVIRAEEWLPSTPKHIILHEMLGWKAPEYAHLSMILPPDKKGKLSKRHGAVSVLDFKKEGFLPEALINFIAFLGWNPKSEKEDYSLAELIEEFKIENLNKAPAIFNRDKLLDISEKYLKKEISENPSKIKSLLTKDFELHDITPFELMLVSRGGYSTLAEMAKEIRELREKPEYEGTLLVFKKSTVAATKKGLVVAKEVIEGIDEKDFNAQELQMKLSLAVSQNDLTNGDLFWPIRVALSGKEKSPSPVELLMALGKDESLARLSVAEKKVK